AQNQSARPASLYHAQLAERLGPRAVENLKRRPVPAARGPAPSAEEPDGRTGTTREVVSTTRALSVRNGWLLCDGRLLVGARGGTAWWRGSVLPARAGEVGAGVTRFVPGRSGPGYTDDLDALTDDLRAAGKVVLEHHWGLWYDRRRDDHQMVRRA